MVIELEWTQFATDGLVTIVCPPLRWWCPTNILFSVCNKFSNFNLSLGIFTVFGQRGLPVRNSWPARDINCILFKNHTYCLWSHQQDHWQHKVSSCWYEEWKLKEGFHSIAQFPNVIVATYGTLIPIPGLSGAEEPNFVCRKGYHVINVQAVADHNLR